MMNIMERPATQTRKRRSVHSVIRLRAYKQDIQGARQGEDTGMAAETRHQKSQGGIMQGPGTNRSIPMWKPADSVLRRLTGNPDILNAFGTPRVSRRRLLAGTWERLGLVKFALTNFRAQPREKIVSYCLQMQLDEAGRVGGADPFSGRQYCKSNTELCEILGFPLPPPAMDPDWGTIDDQIGGPGWQQMLNEHTGSRRMGVRGLSRSFIKVRDITDDVFRSWLTWVSTWLQGKPGISSCSISDFNIAWELWTGKLHPLFVLTRSLKGGTSGINVKSTAVAAYVFAHAMGNLIVPVTPKDVNIGEDMTTHHHWTRWSSKRQKKEHHESETPKRQKKEHHESKTPSDRSFPHRKQPQALRELPPRPPGVERETCRGNGQKGGRGARPYERPSKNSNATSAGMVQHTLDLDRHSFAWNGPVKAVEVIAKRGAFVAARAPEGNRNPAPGSQGCVSMKECKKEAMEDVRYDAGTDGSRPIESSRQEVTEKWTPVRRPTPRQAQPWGALTIDEVWENFVLEKSCRVVSDIQKQNLESRVEWLQKQFRKTEDELRKRMMHWKASYQKACSCRDVRAGESRSTAVHGEKGNGDRLGHAGPTVQRPKEREEQLERLQMLESTLEELAGEFRRVTYEKEELQNWVNEVPAALEKMKHELFEKMDEKITEFANAKKRIPKSKSAVAGGQANLQHQEPGT